MASASCAGYVLLTLDVAFLLTVQGVTVSPCGNDQTAEVIQGKTDNTFTCSGAPSGQTITWRLLYQNSNSLVGSCPPDGNECTQGVLGDAFFTTRVSGSTTIRLTVDPTKLTNYVIVKSGTLMCSTTANNHSCQTDYVVPANGTCSLQNGTGSNRFNVTGSCRLQAGAVTSRNRYRCEWYSKLQASQKSLVTNKTLTEANYRTACDMSSTVPTATGRYIYAVTLIPGREEVNAGEVNIERPSTPSISCSPSGFVPVNTPVTCNCSTTKVGQPQGRLKGVKVTDGSIIRNGMYGASSLQLPPQTLRAGDHGVTVFRCDVEWAEDVAGGNSYTARVGLPPNQSNLSLNGNQGNRVVNESQSVTFDCASSGGRPTPTVKLVNQDNNTELLSGQSTLQHTVRARCEDSGVYVCTADNSMGPVATSVDTILSVQCSPRGEEQLKEVNYTADPVSVTYDVIAYPVPHEVSFAYLGQCGCKAGAARAVRGITLEGDCKAKTGAVYMSTCTVTVSSVTTAEAAGLYQVIFTNTVGSVTFQLNVEADVSSQTQSGGSGTVQASIVGLAVAFGALLAVVLVAITVVLVWLWRHQWKLPCAYEKEMPPEHARVPNKRNASSVVELSQESSPEPLASDRGTYQSLQMSDVGQMSTYSVINHHGNQSPQSTEANTVQQNGSLYENLGTRK